MKMISFSAILFCLFISCGLTQSDVKGKVTSATDGSAIAGATIYVVSIYSTGEWTGTSDANGNYKISKVENGQIRIDASATGYLTSSVLDDHMSTTEKNFLLTSAK